MYELLTQEDKNALGKRAAEIEWGFTPESIREEIRKWESGSMKQKQEVVYLLEDCNFHALANLLDNGDLYGAKNWADEEMPLEG